ncbi:unnamed protein product [Staurois parvus]|uniref:Uncharacterized protein n=1 Tax=Staurois parvus TaxID=386267 RepID=A0ABN9HDU8_9NEOB|nr:unnamed protein product [Staurois parvus]
METAAMGGRSGTHERLWTWQQHEEGRYRGPCILRAWQQQWRPVICQHVL